MATAFAMSEHVFSAYWWQRNGACITRLLHCILCHMPHKMWLYVDDLLAALLKSYAPLQLTWIVAIFCIINAPVSWKRAQFGDTLIWCDFCIATQTAHLCCDKLRRLCHQLNELLHSKQADRKELERCLGLLMWATSMALHLRPPLAPLYSDLHSPPARLWSRLLHCLRPQAMNYLQGARPLAPSRR